MQKIRFGTSGWRAIIGDGFTFEALRRVSQAIADLVLEQHNNPEVVVGYDARFMGERFAEEVTKVMLGSGVRVQLALRDVPTPAIAATIMGEKLAGGINITASHNPATYSGVKFSPAWGGPALPEDTKKIEQRIAELENQQITCEVDFAEARSSGRLRFTECKKHYFSLVRQNIDFDAIKQANVRVVFDPLFGSARGFFDELLESAGIEFSTINSFRDPYFGGGPPEPDSERLAKLRHLVSSQNDVVLGLATDGDGDRFGIVDSDGTFFSPNQILPLLADYLYQSRPAFKNKQLVRSVATTHMMDRVAQKFGVEMIETPVGFKYIGKLLSANRAFFGGEESAGLSMAGHVPEKDGILACLLTLEMVAREGKSLAELLSQQQAKLGALYSERRALPLSEQASEKWQQLGSINADAFDQPIGKRDSQDGFKFVFENNEWLLFRKSGTEPVVRTYAEAPSQERVRALLEQASRVLNSF